MVVVMLMVFVVDILLLSATGQFLGGYSHPVRILLGALMETAFAGLSMVPGFSFLHHFLWRLCILGMTVLIAFGFSFRKMILFALLHLSLGSLSGGEKEMTSMLLGAAGIAFACIAVGREKRFVPIELSYRGQTITLTALRDTGNTLRDPITGKQVLIIGADAAQRLTGLTEAALCDPVRTMGKLPGLRLIPYQTVGNTGFLLALPMQNVKIGNQRVSTLVALSPCIFDHRYQALTGGNL